MSDFFDITLLTPFIHLATDAEWGPHALIDLVACVINVWLLLAAMSLSEWISGPPLLRERFPSLVKLVNQPIRLTRYLLILRYGNNVPTWAPAVVTFTVGVLTSAVLMTILKEVRATAP